MSATPTTEPEDDGPDGMLAYALACANPSKDDPHWPLPSFDARDWATAFREKALALGYSEMDEGWLIGWFANALMRGFDEAGFRRSGAAA